MSSIQTTPTTWEFMTMPLHKYVDFSGRSRRSEYWWFQVFQVLVGIAFSIVEASFGAMGANTVGSILEGFSDIFSLAMFIPSIAVGVRRLHDIGRSGWWLLLVFTIIGIVVLLVWHCTDSEPGSNKWGPNPKNPQEMEIDTIDHLITEDD